MTRTPRTRKADPPEAQQPPPPPPLELEVDDARLLLIDDLGSVEGIRGGGLLDLAGLYHRGLLSIRYFGPQTGYGVSLSPDGKAAAAAMRLRLRSSSASCD